MRPRPTLLLLLVLLLLAGPAVARTTVSAEGVAAPVIWTHLEPNKPHTDARRDAATMVILDRGSFERLWSRWHGDDTARPTVDFEHYFILAATEANAASISHRLTLDDGDLTLRSMRTMDLRNGESRWMVVLPRIDIQTFQGQPLRELATQTRRELFPAPEGDRANNGQRE